MGKGILLTFEGIDGSGKSSAARAVYTALVPHHKVLLTREPGATQLGVHLRELVQHASPPVGSRVEYLLFAADRAHHITELVVPHLAQGFIVISDRMADSSMAYQGYGRGLDTDFINRVNSWALQGITPDLTIYLRLPYETAYQRIEKRAEKKTVLEQEEATFFKRVSEGFDTLFKERTNVITVDATQAQEQVHAECIERVCSFLTYTRV